MHSGRRAAADAAATTAATATAAVSLQVLEADLHLELLLPCTVLDARELVPSNSALPRPDTPAASAAAVGAAARAERAAMVTARASFLARAAATQASDEAKEDNAAEYRGDSK